MSAWCRFCLNDSLPISPNTHPRFCKIAAVFFRKFFDDSICPCASEESSARRTRQIECSRRYLDGDSPSGRFNLIDLLPKKIGNRSVVEECSGDQARPMVDNRTPLPQLWRARGTSFFADFLD